MVFRLKKGDLIDILAPGSFIDEDENFLKGIEILKNWGLEINEIRQFSETGSLLYKNFINFHRKILGAAPP